VDLGGAGRVQAGGVGGGKQHGVQPLDVAQAVGRDAAQVGENMLERHLRHGERSVMSGATNVPRIGRAQIGSS